MRVTHLMFAIALLAGGTNKGIQVKDVRVVSVTRNRLDARSETVQLGEGQSEEIAKILAQGELDPAVFYAEYAVQIEYKHKRKIILVNGTHFKYEGRTYQTREDLGSFLSTAFK
jgi:hypothetical protein